MLGIDQEAILHQQELLRLHRRTLQHYLKQQIMLGIFSPPGITHGICEAREEIRRIKESLRAAGVDVPDSPDDASVLVADGSIEAATLGEILLLIVPFAGQFLAATAHPEWTIRDTLDRQNHTIAWGKRPVRVELWHMPVSSKREACELGAAYGATLVFWGLFDDTIGIETHVEILRDVPLAAIQIGGQLNYVSGIPSMAIRFTTTTRSALIEQLPAQAKALAGVALGVTALIEGQLHAADRLLSLALDAPALTDSADLAAAYYYRGLARTLQERFREAQSDIDLALTYTPDSPLALTQRGIVALAVGDIPIAEALFVQALGLLQAPDPIERIRLFVNLGLAIELQGRADHARQCYEHALALSERGSDPQTRALIQMQFGAMSQRQQNDQAAFGWYRAALDLGQELSLPLIEALANSGLGRLYDAQGQAAEALRAFREAYKRAQAGGSPGLQAQQLLHIGMLFLDEQLVNEAESLFRQALQLNLQAGLLCGQARTYSSLGRACAIRGDIPAAIVAFEQAERLFDSAGSPDRAGVREMLAQMHQRGKKAKDG